MCGLDDDERSRLRSLLAACPDVEPACAVAADVLAGSGLLVTAYLRQGERLRCRAVRGYWQIFDDMAGRGVIGATFRSGQRTLVRVESTADYLAASPDVLGELCVPLRVAGEVVGVLNVESTAALTGEQERRTDLVCELLAERLAELPLPVESAAQKLGRHAAALPTLAAGAEESVLLDAIARAAVDISGMESAALYLLAHDGLPVPQATTGPLAPVLGELSDEQLTRMASWVATGTSCYTVGSTEGMGMPGHEQLRSAGAASLVVLPLPPTGGERGMLVAASAQVLRLRTDRVELLELLAAVIASCLQIAHSVHGLRQRAAEDALTGLGHHASFHATLPASRHAGSTGRLAVLYIDVDHFKAVNDTDGHAAGDRLLQAIADCMRDALRDADRLFRIGGDEFAVLAQVHDDEQARALGARLLETVRRKVGATLSVGVAVEEPGESDTTLLARADAAVYAAKAAGRATVRVASTDRVDGPPRPRSGAGSPS